MKNISYYESEDPGTGKDHEVIAYHSYWTGVICIQMWATLGRKPSPHIQGASIHPNIKQQTIMRPNYIIEKLVPF